MKSFRSSVPAKASAPSRGRAAAPPAPPGKYHAAMPRPLPCPDRVNVLLVGGGGREHALAWKLRQSPRLGRLWLSDTVNVGLAPLGEACPIPVDIRAPFHIRRWLEAEEVSLIIVGPEAPLAEGITDILATERCHVFGPTRAAAQIEADKAYAKQLMRQAAVPTAEGRIFDRASAALEFVQTRDEPCVVKAAGLAAGKGVVVCDDGKEAAAAINSIMTDRVHGDAGARIIVEERLQGQEVSMLAFVDGRTIWMLDSAQDHKQVGEGDTGPNTGGMGAYSPTPLLSEALLSLIEREVFVPVIDALRRDDAVFRGVLYAGMMLTAGGPKVLEFNCRFGDPECQTLLPRLRGDLVEICWATATGGLDQIAFTFDERCACTVVVCSGGYPGDYRKGLPIEGLTELEADAAKRDDLFVFHAGTTRKRDGTVVTNGGRVASVTALAADLATARARANDAAARIRFDGAFFRSDIGHRVREAGSGLSGGAGVLRTAAS